MHLRVRVNAVELGTGVTVPEADAAVSSAASRSQQVGLEGAPGQRLDRSTVGCEAQRWGLASGCACCPNVQQVVIASTGQLLSIWGPLQAANFLLMALEHCLDMLSHSAHNFHCQLSACRRADTPAMSANTL